MSIPLVSDVYLAARAELGDTLNATGERFFDAILQPFYKRAYAELFRAMQKYQNPRLNRVAHYNVPAYTGYLTPATAGISNCGEVLEVEERGSIVTASVSVATPGAASLAVTTAAPHGFASGQPIVFYGMAGLTDDVNDQFPVTVTGASALTVNGCTATGTYTSGGVASYSAEKFAELRRSDTPIDYETSAGNSLGAFTWESDVLRFHPASGVRQIRIYYSLSGAAPTTTTASVGVDDSLDFLSVRTAALAAMPADRVTVASTLNAQSVGPEWESRGIAGGLLGQFIDAGVRALQALPPEQLRSASRRQRVVEV